jgi:endoglucanase
MKNLIKLFVFITVVVSIVACDDDESQNFRSTPFSKGVNFSAWFQSYSASAIPFNRYVEQDFADIKTLGVDVIRLPVSFPTMTSGAPDYKIEPLLLKLLDIAVNWAEKYKIYLIIDNHPLNHDLDESRDKDMLLKIWSQIAEHFKNRSDYVLYEIYNEPGISIDYIALGSLQGEIIDAIRSIDKKHTIVVVGGRWASIDGMLALPVYSDDNLIYTFHFYDPFVFTHQGATWDTLQRMGYLSGYPWPYDKNRMPETPPEVKGTYIGDVEINNYSIIGTEAAILAQFEKAVTFSKKRNVPVFCGELGVLMWNAPAEDRIRWYKFVCRTLSDLNIAWASWDYYGGFGIFNNGNFGLDFNSDLNIELVRAMGFTPPPQRQKTAKPLNSGFTIYDDYVAREFNINFNPSRTRKPTASSLYDKQAADGKYAIRWENADKNEGFNFYRSMDLSKLAAAGYILEFRARTDDEVRFDVRFEMPETKTSIPWRMRYTVDQTILPPDGKWHKIRIPLKKMQEQGAYVSATQEWRNPEQAFSWEQIGYLKFDTGDNDLLGKKIWFDLIRIVAP